MPPLDYNKVAKVADAEWADGVRLGIFIDDDEAEFLGARLVANSPLAADCLARSEQYREMLRSLVIPEDWQIEFGLCRISSAEDTWQIVEMLAG